jgi:2-polyprenyl-3-methyl-5-hydroxy-6-metoxy-1,4-benzoquinol methylase
MQYDPIKRSIGNVVRNNVMLRKLFYFLLGVLFLREWYAKKELRKALANASVKNFYDAGSGFGQYSYFVAKNFPQVSVYGVDVKDEQIDDCKRFFQNAGLRNASFAIEDLTKINHREKFDAILSVDVMEHILDDVQVFKNFYTAMKPGGTLIVNTPSHLAEDHDHDHEEGEHFVEEHVRDGYSPEDITTKLKAAGFHIERVSYTYGNWGKWYWHLAIKYPILMVGASKAFFLVLPFYYAVTFPFALVFMMLDMVAEKPEGTGVMAIAKKN